MTLLAWTGGRSIQIFLIITIKFGLCPSMKKLLIRGDISVWRSLFCLADRTQRYRPQDEGGYPAFIVDTQVGSRDSDPSSVRVVKFRRCATRRADWDIKRTMRGFCGKTKF